MTDDRFLRMSTPELDRRWALVRGLIADHGLDAVLTLCSDDDMGGYVRWLTDGPVLPYRRGVLFARDGAMAVVEHGGQGAHRAPHPGDANYRGITDIWGVAEFPVVDYSLHYEAEVVVAEIRRRDYRRIALVGAGNMPHRFVSHIEEALSGTVTFSDETAAFDGFMVVKSEEEQAAICRAAALQDELMALALRTIRPGLLEAELTATLRAHAQARGAEGGIILAGSGPQGTFAPFKPIARQNRHIEPGDVVALLVENSGPGGYFTEIARNFVVGKAEAVVAEAVAAATEMQQAIKKRFLPGTACADIFAAHNRDRAARGLPAEDRIFAHGQGYNLVERPLIRDDEPMQVAAGMNFAIHPTIADPRTVFAIMCDNYIVGPDGTGTSLHSTEQRLFEV